VTQKRVLFVAFAVLAAVLVAVPASAGKGGWTTVDLGIGNGSEACAINDHGVVVGDSSSGGFIWKDGSVTYLGPGTSARAINDHGDVAGMQGQQAVLWHDGQVTDLGTLEAGGWSRAYAINKSDVVVGEASVAGGSRYHAFVWQKGVMTDLGDLGGGWSGASDVNDRGVVVGFSGMVGSVAHGFVWEDGSMVDLGASDWASWGDGINNRGEIAGVSPVGPHDHAVRWQDGAMEDLNGSGLASEAYAVNDHGVIVGRFVPTLQSHFGYPALWKDGVWTQLNTDTGDYGFALAVNNHEQAVGYTLDSSGSSSHAVLFDPN
jgi:probable HAF family extracellular repeat protein